MTIVPPKDDLEHLFRQVLKEVQLCRATIAPPRMYTCASRLLIMGERRLHGTARSILKDKQHVQFHRSARHLPAGWAATWDRPRRFVQNFCWWRERKQFFFPFSSSGPRLFEGRQQ